MADHGHGSSHGEYDKQDPQVALVVFFGVGILIATAITAVWLRGWFDVVSVTETSQKLGAYPNTEWDALKKQGQDKLAAPLGWTDKTAGTVHMPIARAMELVVQEAKAGPPGPVPPTADDKKKDAPKKPEPKK